MNSSYSNFFKTVPGEDSSIRKKDRLVILFIQALAAGLLVALFMYVFESVKEILFPFLSIWNSHLVTILFSGTLTVVLTFILLKNRNAILQKIIKESRETTESGRMLARSLSLLKATFEASDNGVLVVDRNGKITEYNSRFTQMWQIPADFPAFHDDNETLSRILAQLKDPDGFIKRVRDLNTKPEAESFDIVECNDRRIFERYSLPQRLDNITVGRVWSFRDITERRQTEERLALLAHTLESITESVSITDINDTIIFVNNAFLNIYGYSEEEVIGKNIEILRSTRNDPSVTKEILPATLRGQWKGEIWNKKKNGSDFLLSLSTTIVRGIHAEPLALVGVGSDITQKKIEEEEKEKLIGDLQKALGEVKELNGLLPICSSCKKIRDDKGYWNHLESYLSRRSNVEFSHAICPDCIQQLYPEFALRRGLTKPE